MYEIISLKDNELLMLTEITNGYRKSTSSTHYYDIKNNKVSESIFFPDTIVTSNMNEEKIKYVNKWYNLEEKFLKPDYENIVDLKIQTDLRQYLNKYRQLGEEKIKKEKEKLYDKHFINDKFIELERKMITLKTSENKIKKNSIKIDKIKEEIENYKNKYIKELKSISTNIKRVLNNQYKKKEKEVNNKYNVNSINKPDQNFQIRKKWINEKLNSYPDMSIREKNKILEIYEEESIKQLHFEKNEDNFDNFDILTNNGLNFN